MTLNIDRSIYCELFDFEKFTYNVLQETVPNNFIGSLLRCEPESTRYWISRVRKGPYLEKRQMSILCRSHSSLGDEYTFAHPTSVGGEYYKVVYWYRMNDPVNLIRGVRAKVDLETLPENLVLSSDDLTML
jgi:hypothetical protein